MPTGHIMMAMSLDGFVARLDRTLDWLVKQPTNGEDHGFENFQSSVDVIVMGSGSFKTLLGFDDWAYSKPVVVLSGSMAQSDIPNHLKKKVELTNETPTELMKRFDKLCYERVYVDGGAIIQSFLKLGFVKDMKVTIVPILIGTGIRLFGDIDNDIDLKLEVVAQHPSGLVSLNYSLV